MWEARYEKTFQNISKEAIWKTWADVNNWPQWDSELETVKMTGPFSAGTHFKLKPKGGPVVSIEITEISPLKSFVDVTHFPFAKMFDHHELEETTTGLIIRSKLEMKGPLGWLWRRLVAQDVANGVPAQLESLVNYARKQQS